MPSSAMLMPAVRPTSPNDDCVDDVMLDSDSKAPAGAVPLTTFKGQLRQINAASAGVDGLAMLRLCVPCFFELDAAADDAATCAGDGVAGLGRKPRH